MRDGNFSCRRSKFWYHLFTALTRGKVLRVKVDRLTSVIEKVNRDSFVLQPDGKPIPQTTKPELIYDMLRLLDINEGDSVLEIGTGSGYSTALLATLVGDQGSVVSLDIESHLIDRAQRLFAQQGLSNVNAFVSDGRNGYSGNPSFNRIVAWCTADHIPVAWCNQTMEDAIMVLPIKILPFEGSTLVVKVRMEKEQMLAGERVIVGSFIPMLSEPLPLKPLADVIITKNEIPITWGSAEWARQSESSVRRFTHLLEGISVQGNLLLLPEENPWDYRAFLLAKRPHGITIIYTKSMGLSLGYSDADGLAVLSLFGTGYAQAGNKHATEILLEWIEEWRATGRLGMDRLRPVLQRENDVWKVSVRIV